MNTNQVIMHIILTSLVPVLSVAAILCFAMVFWSIMKPRSKRTYLQPFWLAFCVTFYFWFDSYGNPHFIYVNDQWTSLIVWLNSEPPTVHPNITPVYPQPNPRPPAI